MIKKLKRHWSTIILIFIFILGISLLLYPVVSDYWNSFHQTRAISSYMEAVSEIDEATYDKLWKNAKNYNKELAKHGMNWKLSDEEIKEYESMLSLTENGIMGYVDIPSIDVQLPIYHGTSASVLQKGVGHIEGSSLPVGGESTHTLISGHRGLPTAKLFSNLDKLVEGDIFHLSVLDTTLTYEVDKILTVEPEDLSSLTIEEGKDYCTLITCTPYGVNTHRLLVRGHRIKNDTDIRVAADAMQIDTIIVVSVVAVPLLLLLLIALLVTTRRKK